MQDRSMRPRISDYTLFLILPTSYMCPTCIMVSSIQTHSLTASQTHDTCIYSTSQHRPTNMSTPFTLVSVFTYVSIQSNERPCLWAVIWSKSTMVVVISLHVQSYSYSSGKLWLNTNRGTESLLMILDKVYKRGLKNSVLSLCNPPYWLEGYEQWPVEWLLWGQWSICHPWRLRVRWICIAQQRGIIINRL